jgi:hypothetical protein
VAMAEFSLGFMMRFGGGILCMERTEIEQAWVIFELGAIFTY